MGNFGLNPGLGSGPDRMLATDYWFNFARRTLLFSRSVLLCADPRSGAPIFQVITFYEEKAILQHGID
jgi:hypothetical protein